MLGLSRRTVIRYRNGQSVVPKIVKLACANIEENDMAYSKDINMHKRRAMGETITGMKSGGKADCYASGGAVKAVHKHEKVMHPGKKMTPLKKGGKSC